MAKLEEQWLSLNKKIDHELHRLQTLLKHLLRCVFSEIDRCQILLWRKTTEGLCTHPILHVVPLYMVLLGRSETVRSLFWAKWGLESLMLVC